MPDLLLELFSEEIPARMQAQAASDLQKLVTDALVERGLSYEGAASHATPRRLALHVAGLPARQPDVREERRGPRVGAPEKALEGFLKSAGLSSIEEAKVVADPKGKGEFYVALIERTGAATVDVLAEILPGIVRGFPWPKSMRWGAASARTDSLRWVRPLHSILCTFGPETEEPEIVRFEVDGIASSNQTRGHRFMAPDAFAVRRFDDYVPALQKAKVVLEAGRRSDIIRHDARDLAHAQGLEVVEDEALLNEVAGLVEWPVVLMGEFDEAFLEIPDEVIRATIRANQKCFVLKKPDGALASKFILVANVEASDGGAMIAGGNGRVVRARLSDAFYFWKTDQADLPDYVNDANRGKPLDQRMAKLRALNIVFHEKLGTQAERVDRIKALARELAPMVGADADKAERAAELCKADLVTEVVGEFPETQGLMGRYYAQIQGEDADVCAALEDHYRPVGPSDRIPANPVAIAVALADKLDTLVGFWAIDEKPTGSKDPYALRRAALGVIRILLEKGVRLGLADMIFAATNISLWEQDHAKARVDALLKAADLIGGYAILPASAQKIFFAYTSDDRKSKIIHAISQSCADLISFFHDRLKVYLRDQGARHDLIDAALGAEQSPHAEEARSAVSKHEGTGTGGASFETRPVGAPQDEGYSSAQQNDDLLMVVRRVEALGKFLETDDGKNLLAGYKRAANIVRAEEKKDKTAAGFDDAYAATLDAPEAEQLLAGAVEAASIEAARAVTAEDFEGAMTALSRLRSPVDAFFEAVTVNDADAGKRLNRLRLLNALRRAVHTVADFSKIAG